jgi:Raf kinase inhibitor-like YbhB/YbcL family protein
VSAGAVLVLLALVGCGSSGAPSQETGTSEVGTKQLAVASPDFRRGGAIPKQFTCNGAGTRPPLAWAGVPPNAAEVAVLVGDPDAPGGTFVHWVVWGLRPTARGSVSSDGLPAGAIEGANSAGGTGWTPPCPPSGTHHYRFTVYRLSAPTGLAGDASPSEAFTAIGKAATAQGRLTGVVTHQG